MALCSLGRLCAAFDCTYLSSTLSQLGLHGEHAIVGGVFGLGDTDKSFLSLDRELDVRKVTRASSMLELVVWDPCAVKKVVLSACAIPVETNFSGPACTIRGCWYMLELIGMILAESGNILRSVTFDAHGSHSLVRRLCHGQLQGINVSEIGQLKFWQDLEWQPMPHCCLPRLPVQKCLHRGGYFLGIPGVCPLAGISTGS